MHCHHIKTLKHRGVLLTILSSLAQDESRSIRENSTRKILSNEKYKGDALLQKTYTIDFLTQKRAVNNGEVPQYYVEESHLAIIDKEMWENSKSLLEFMTEECGLEMSKIADDYFNETGKNYFRYL